MSESSKASAWLNRGNAQEDPIYVFQDFWIGFNNLYNNSSSSKESEKIKTWIEDNVSEGESQQILQDYVLDVDYLLLEPVINMANGKEITSNRTSFESAVDSKMKLKELFMIIYKVRCNLLHGQKTPSRERDVKLCQSASPFVKCMLTR